MNHWSSGYPAAQTTLDCGGERHRLRWEAGTLRSLDHDDAEGERTLAALGGHPSPCIDLLDAWHRHTDDLQLLTLATRGPTDPLAPQPDPFATGATAGGGIAPLRRRPSSFGVGRGSFSRFRSSGAGARTFTHSGRGGLPPSPADEVIALLGLGGGLPDRLVATVAAEWTQRLTQQDATVPQARPQLYAALWGRLTATLRSWLGDHSIQPELDLVAEHVAPTVTEHDATIHVQLPFAWLVRVWGRGLGTISGRFCLDATTEDGQHLVLTTIGPDFREPRIVTIEIA